MKEQDIELDVADNASQEGKRKRMNVRRRSEKGDDSEGEREGEVAVKLESEEKKEFKNNSFVEFWLDCRRVIINSFFSKSRGAKIFWLLVWNGIFLTIIIASILSAIRNKGKNTDWCTGVGFLWLIFGLLYYGILYYIGKRYLGQYISKSFEPVLRSFKNIKANKYFRLACYFTPPIGMAIFVTVSPGKSGKRIFSFIGILVFISIGFLISKYPGQVNWRPVISGIFLQFVFGWMTIQIDFGRRVLECIGLKMTQFLAFTDGGSEFVYGILSHGGDGSPPIFAFSVLPVIFFLSFVVGILNYYGILPFFVLKMAWIMKLLMGTTVCESVNAAASIFLSMTEAPLLIKSYFEDLTKSEICAILCAGWSTVAGVVMAAYIRFGINASHLISASIMSAPASLSLSKLMYPETEESKTTLGNIQLNKDEAKNALDAGTRGALGGIIIVGGIIANIIAFLGFVGFLDGLLQWIGNATDFENLSFHFVLSKVFYPVSFLMGIEEDSLETVAYLVGMKTVVNEFQAYQLLGELVKENKLSERSEIITTYALCGFSNFASIGITIGAMSSIAPQRMSAITEVAMTAFVAANIVCFLTACVAGCFIE